MHFFKLGWETKCIYLNKWNSWREMTRIFSWWVICDEWLITDNRNKKILFDIDNILMILLLVYLNVLFIYGATFIL